LAFPPMGGCKGFRTIRPRSCACGCYKASQVGASQVINRYVKRSSGRA
jgi:hypothetical protein